ncbi:hypothetical protein DAPPUDRAFT_119396 [Daphnia pulex]|uniref:Uncharacterized protein n=1 Tax=Daphnia pulex TaxID=6669 RepID=E9HYE7_DAPPU|nr:hypothetical protein DAPPUDRAFT_119396 [Daphnia pulex]|eukprot:EFX63232.1 hypothetical protein DAPPUDRAFT_119396 [Daphnia pulex]
MRKQYSNRMTFEEAVQHENKAVDNPSGDIESTDNEKEKRSRATSNKPGSSVVRSSNDLVDFEEDTFPSRSTPPKNPRALASTSKYRDDGIVNQFRQNEAGNRRPKVTSIPFESSDQFVQRGIVSISHDMRDNRSLGSAVLEQLKKIETRLMMEQDLEQDLEQDEFLLDFPLKSIDDFHSFDEEMLKNNCFRKKLHTHLTGIGGNDGRNIVRSIAKRLISKDLDLNAKSKPRNVILISGVMNLGCPSAPIWVGLLTFFRPPNALLCGCLAVQWMFDGCFEHPCTTSVEHPWGCPVLCGFTPAKKFCLLKSHRNLLFPLPISLSHRNGNNFAKTTPATFDTGYPDTGYPTLATHKAGTGYPDTGYPTLAIPNLLPLENGSYTKYSPGHRPDLISHSPETSDPPLKSLESDVVVGSELAISLEEETPTPEENFTPWQLKLMELEIATIVIHGWISICLFLNHHFFVGATSETLTTEPGEKVNGSRSTAGSRKLFYNEQRDPSQRAPSENFVGANKFIQERTSPNKSYSSSTEKANFFTMTDEEWLDLYWDQFEEDGDKKEKQYDKEDKNEEETAKEEEKETVKEEEKETAKEEEKEIAAKANEGKPAENELAVPEPSKSAKRRMNFQEKYKSKEAACRQPLENET